MHDLERRQRKEAEKEATRAARNSERERADKDRQARVAAEEQAYEAQLQVRLSGSAMHSCLQFAERKMFLSGLMWLQQAGI